MKQYSHIKPRHALCEFLMGKKWAKLPKLYEHLRT